jgi:hypothetical protein
LYDVNIAVVDGRASVKRLKDRGWGASRA